MTRGIENGQVLHIDGDVKTIRYRFDGDTLLLTLPNTTSELRFSTSRTERGNSRFEDQVFWSAVVCLRRHKRDIEGLSPSMSTQVDNRTPKDPDSQSGFLPIFTS